MTGWHQAGDGSGAGLGPRAPGRVLSTLGLVLTLVAGGGARAAGEPAAVMVVAAAEDPPGSPAEVLQHAVAASLSPYGVEVQLQRDGRGPLDELAAEMAGRDEVIAALWLERDDPRLCLRVPALWVGARERPLPRSGDGWAADCHAISAIVLSELEPLLAGRLDDPPQPAPGGERTAASADEEVPEITPSEAEVPVSPAGPEVALVVGAGYLPVVIDRGAPYRSGLGLALGVLLGRHLELGAGVDLIQPADVTATLGGGWLARTTVRGVATGWLPLGPAELGLALGAVVERAQVRRLDYDPLDAGALEPRVHGAFTAALRVRVRVLPWLAPFAEGGADLYGTRLSVVDAGSELIGRAPVQPRLAVGIAGVIPLRRGRDR